MSIFQRKPGNTDYFDQITIGSYSFDCAVTVREKRGDPSAIHCGRIVYLEMICEDEIIAYFADGKWYLSPENSFDSDFNEAACIGRDMLVEKYSNPDRLKMKGDISNGYSW